MATYKVKVVICVLAKVLQFKAPFLMIKNILKGGKLKMLRGASSETLW